MNSCRAHVRLEVTPGRYRRTISLRGNEGYFEISLDENREALSVHIQFDDSRALFLIIERIPRMFDLSADWQPIAARLRTDSALAERIQNVPGLRVPGCWNGFELATRAILGQQITVKGATALAGRIASAFGRPCSATGNLTHLFPTPEALADARLISVGLTNARAETIKVLARAVCDGRISFEGIAETEAFLARLCEIPGIGQWTAQYVAMRALGEPDAFPSSDLGLLRALNLECARDLELRSEAWRPWRAYAAMYLWNSARERSARGSTTVLSRSRKTPIERNLVRERTVMSYVTATLPRSANKR
jgi:AraC family transcriptional regulator of adaptative response / DNA-3-methyladenine glycosylase II